jgi:hypothetical protein
MIQYAVVVVLAYMMKVERKGNGLWSRQYASTFAKLWLHGTLVSPTFNSNSLPPPHYNTMIHFPFRTLILYQNALTSSSLKTTS